MRHKNGFWTKEQCQAELLKYNTLKDFKKNSFTCYKKCLTKGWLNEIGTTLIRTKHMDGFWNKERCHNIALKYSYRKDFRKNEQSVYIISHREGWIDEICSHMLVCGNKYNRCVYAYEFPDNSVYIGLTYDLIRRHSDHIDGKDKDSRVYKHIIKTGLIPKFIQSTEFIDADLASKKEIEKRDEYYNKGWNILNVAKCGSIGGSIPKWTKENCIKEASKYNY